MKYIFIIILLMACTAGVALAQAVTWTDINGALNYSLLHESGNGTIFATYGTSPSANSTYGLYYSTDVGLTWSQTPYSGDVDDLPAALTLKFAR